MRRRSQLRRSPLRRVNPERRARTFARNFGSKGRAQWIAQQPCDACGAVPTAPFDGTGTVPMSQNSHVVPRGAGGAGGDASMIVPHCHACHREFEAGPEAFRRRHGLTRQQHLERALTYDRAYRSMDPLVVGRDVLLLAAPRPCGQPRRSK